MLNTSANPGRFTPAVAPCHYFEDRNIAVNLLSFFWINVRRSYNLSSSSKSWFWAITWQPKQHRREIFENETSGI
jgi:hypothetical protein